MGRLYEDQQKAVAEIKRWYSSGKAYHTLSGPAGTGKSHVIEEILTSIPRVKPVLLCPTHKALGQLKEKVQGDYDFRTVANSLGIRPVDIGNVLKFEHTKLPSFWGSVNLAIVDEGGMLDDFQLNLFKSIGMKILYVGHQSQLPPVKRNRSMFDKCVSPVFDQGYGESILYIPKRNTGALWDYNNLLEKKIYDDSIKIPLDYDIGRKDLNSYISSQRGKAELLVGETKFALWTNEGVNRYNSRIRDILFGKESYTKYLKNDLVIFTNSFTSFDGMDLMNDRTILKFESKGIDVYTDTDGVVLSCKEVVVNLNKSLSLQCYKLEIDTRVEGRIFAYELIHKDDYKRIADYYEHIAWGRATKSAKDKAYAERSTILHCFAQVRHFYASTVHRLQGSSVPNIVSITSDVNKNSNRIERAKCNYVSCSRAIYDLKVYRGV